MKILQVSFLLNIYSELPRRAMRSAPSQQYSWMVGSVGEWWFSWKTRLQWYNSDFEIGWQEMPSQKVYESIFKTSVGNFISLYRAVLKFWFWVWWATTALTKGINKCILNLHGGDCLWAFMNFTPWTFWFHLVSIAFSSTGAVSITMPSIILHVHSKLYVNVTQTWYKFQSDIPLCHKSNPLILNWQTCFMVPIQSRILWWL